MIIFRTSKHVEDLIMLSFAGRLCERHAMAAALIGCARRIRATAANWRHAAIASVTDPYRPELHYMRGPGPKWHAKYDGLLTHTSPPTAPALHETADSHA